RILDRIEKPEAVDQFIAAMEALLPDIDVVHAEAGRLLREGYLPLLKGERAAWSPEALPPPVIQKTRRRRSRVRRMRMRIPSPERSLPGESPEEIAPTLPIYRRRETLEKPLPLKDELRWVHQRVWGTNPLLIRNHIESLCDAEVTLFARALDARLAS